MLWLLPVRIIKKKTAGKSLSTMNPYNQGKCQSVVHLTMTAKAVYCKEEKHILLRIVLYVTQNSMVIHFAKSNKSHYQMT